MLGDGIISTHSTGVEASLLVDGVILVEATRTVLTLATIILQPTPTRN